jgi:sugar diacid utilization regulator
MTTQAPVAPAPPEPAAKTIAPRQIGYPDVVGAFSEVAHAINEKADLDSLLHLIAERICSLLQIRRCSVYLRDPSSTIFRGQVAHADHDIDLAIKRLTAGMAADGFTQEILRTQKPVLIGNAQADPRPVRSAMLEWKVRSMLGVPMILRGDVIGLLFLDNEDVPHDYTPEEQELAQTFANLAAIAISQAQLTADQRSALSTVAQQNAILRRAAALEDRLTTLVLEGADLAEIARAVTELTRKPCSIHDAQYRRLAHAAPPDSDVLPRIFDPVALRNPIVREALDGITAQRPAVMPPIPSAGLNHRCLVAPVRVGDEDWGYLVLMEYGSRFGAKDAIVAKRTATVIALELRGQQRAADANLHAIEALARDLLHESDDPVSLARRADYHQIALSEPHHVVLLSRRADGKPRRIPTTAVAEAFALAAPDRRVVVASVEEGVAVILERPDAPTAGEANRAVNAIVEHAIREIEDDGSVTGAISTICRCAADYPGAHEQTRQITRGITTFGAEGQIHVLAAEDLGAGRLLLATTDRSEADRFVRDTLGPLLDEDDAQMRDLFETLRAFFDCGRSVRRCATHLDVHENTVRYRLSRIEDITGQNVLADCDVQLAVQLALLILRLEDRLSRSTAPASADA